MKGFIDRRGAIRSQLPIRRHIAHRPLYPGGSDLQPRSPPLIFSKVKRRSFELRPLHFSFHCSPARRLPATLSISLLYTTNRFLTFRSSHSRENNDAPCPRPPPRRFLVEKLPRRRSQRESSRHRRLYRKPVDLFLPS